MQAYTLKFYLLAIQVKTVVGLNLQGTYAERRSVLVNQLIVFVVPGHRRIQVRLFNPPQLGIFHGQVL